MHSPIRAETSRNIQRAVEMARAWRRVNSCSRSDILMHGNQDFVDSREVAAYKQAHTIFLADPCTNRLSTSWQDQHDRPLTIQRNLKDRLSIHVNVRSIDRLGKPQNLITSIGHLPDVGVGTARDERGINGVDAPRTAVTSSTSGTGNERLCTIGILAQCLRDNGKGFSQTISCMTWHELAGTSGVAEFISWSTLTRLRGGPVPSVAAGHPGGGRLESRAFRMEGSARNQGMRVVAVPCAVSIIPFLLSFSTCLA